MTSFEVSITTNLPGNARSTTTKIVVDAPTRAEALMKGEAVWVAATSKYNVSVKETH